MQGALLKGVQMFNERMISRWRAEGFLDFAAVNNINPAPPPSSALRLPAPGAPLIPRPPASCVHRQGGQTAVEIIRKLLALDEVTSAEEGQGQLQGGGSLHVIDSGRRVEETGGVINGQPGEGDLERRGGADGSGNYAPVGADGGARQNTSGGIGVGIGGQVASRLRPDPLVV